MQLGGRYKLLSTPLSTGSFGSVFMADDERMPRRVAVKVLHPQHAENPTVRARFRRELEAACRVSHENVVSVFDIGEDPRLGLYYVMELVRGTSLKDYLNGEPLPWIFVHRIATQITRALHAIHMAGIVHRDLKPQNIMLVERSSLEELVKVLDFGIASLKNPDEERRDVELTGARMVLGTPPYMSPEQTYMRSDRERLGLDVDARSDIYSLGIILYEMVAGRRPFSGDSHDIVVAHRLTKPMPLDKMVGVSVPREFTDLVMRCLSKDPRERPQSAKDLLQALRDCESKPVLRWDELPLPTVNEEQDEPTLGDHLALPLSAKALGRTGAIDMSVETRPRLDVPQQARTRSIWGPAAAVVVGAAVAVMVFMWTRSGDSQVAVAPIEVEIPSVAVRLPAPAPAQPVVEEPSVDPEVAPEVMLEVAAEVAPKVDPEVVPEVVPEVARKVGVMLTTQPAGAAVLVDGVERGVTPVTLSFPADEVEQLELVLRKARFDDRAVVLPIGPELSGQTLVVHHTLDRKKVRGFVDPFKDL